MPKLFDQVRGSLEVHTTVDTSRPLVGSIKDLQSGNTSRLQQCDLPDLFGIISLDFETCALPEWVRFDKAGLDSNLSRIRLIQVSDGDKCWLIDTFYVSEDMWKPWLRKTLLQADEVLAHNAKFEAKMVYALYGRLPQIKWRCTYVASILLEYTERHSLEDVTLRWVGSQMDKTEQKGDWSAPVLSRAQVLYALTDVVYMHKIHALMLKDLERRGMLWLYENLEAPLIPVLAEIEHTGVPVNQDYIDGISPKFREEVTTLEAKCQQRLYHIYKEMGDPSRLTDILWQSSIVDEGGRIPLPSQMTSPSQIAMTNDNTILQILFSVMVDNPEAPGSLVPVLEIPTVKKAALFTCIHRAGFTLDGTDFNVVWDILGYKNRAKRLEYLDKVSTSWNPSLPKGKSCRHPVTDRVHTEFKYAVTGRILSTSGSGSEDAAEDLMGKTKVNKELPWIMNLQQFPRGEEMRSCFGFTGYRASSSHANTTAVFENNQVVDWVPGVYKEVEQTWLGGTHRSKTGEWGVLSADFSALEAFILAGLSKDPTMLEAVTSRDFHRITASLIFNVPPEEVTPWMRQIAKNVGYATAYGATGLTIAATANMAFIEQQLDIRVSEAEAKLHQRAYFDGYPLVEPYLENEFKYVLKSGWTRPTKLGRTRNINAEVEVEKRNGNPKANARTKAYNNPMQATNVDILKLSLLNIYKWICENLPPDAMIELGTPVHDEQLIFADRSLLPQLGTMLAREMKRAMDTVLSYHNGEPIFNVKVEPAFGPSWGHAH